MAPRSHPALQLWSCTFSALRKGGPNRKVAFRPHQRMVVIGAGVLVFGWRGAHSGPYFISFSFVATPSRLWKEVEEHIMKDCEPPK